MMKLVVRIILLATFARLKLTQVRRIFVFVGTMRFVGTRMVLYRGMRLAAEAHPIPESLGCHWSTNREKAFPYGGKGTQDFYYIYRALVPLSSIDWTFTVDKTLWDKWYEREIVVKKGSPIKLVGVEQVHKVPPVRTDNGWQFPEKIDVINADMCCKA